MTDVVEQAKAALEGVTCGPWKWTDHRVPDLMGRAGEPGVYEYDVEVLEAGHQGECGCRSACTLELAVGNADRAFIAAARDLVPELVAEVERLRAVVDGRVALDREYTDEELRRSPFVHAFKDAVVVSPDEYRSGPGPVPEEGRLWLYISDADGAEVLVRFRAGGWQTADPEVPDRWYATGGELLQWPGRFVEQRGVS